MRGGSSKPRYVGDGKHSRMHRTAQDGTTRLFRRPSIVLTYVVNKLAMTADLSLFFGNAPTRDWTIFIVTVAFSECKASIAFHSVGRPWPTMFPSLLFQASA
ncbi:hypothetical protein HPB52_000832 [Rhipicephalus sanguineus]|uniref:Uncharacterized protein n=1 Tax=Rhipicephalus sanguineus TaxID=34632 RepID=A0A9D4PTE2_RHISA|nr:hypothetical protein HPB52_000832 [Rhipicephalus sanguineus]